MFIANDRHLQMPMFSSIDSLPEKILKRLEASWAVTFYDQVFVLIDESRFAVLYSDEPSRLNSCPANWLASSTRMWAESRKTLCKSRSASSLVTS